MILYIALVYFASGGDMPEKEEDRQSALKMLLGAMLPKEIGQYFQNELSQLRNDFLKALMTEVRCYLSKFDIGSEIQKILDGLEFDVQLKVTVNKRDQREIEKKRLKNNKIKKDKT